MQMDDEKNGFAGGAHCRMISSNICLVEADTDDPANMHDIMDRWRPDKVALSLCPKRTEVLLDWESLGSRKLIDYLRKKGGFFGLISQIFYFSIYSSMQEQGSIDSSLTLTAKKEAENRNLDVIYMDQDLDVLVKRAWKRVSMSEKYAFARLFKRELLSIDGEREKSNGHPDVKMLEQIMDAAPSSRAILEDERLEHMALAVRGASQDSRVIVVVNSEMHDKLAKKIEESVFDEKRMVDLESTPKKFRMSWLRWILSAFLLSLFIYTLREGGWEQTLNTLKWWFVATSLSALIGAVIARAHPYSILAAFVSAPFTSFTFIGAGWIAGIVELKVREPTVGDMTALGRLASWKELFSNKCTKPLAVGLITNGANWIGILIFLPVIIRSIA